jgi:hypothetical protein
MCNEQAGRKHPWYPLRLVEAVSNPHLSNTAWTAQQLPCLIRQGTEAFSFFRADLHCIKWGYETPPSASQKRKIAIFSSTQYGCSIDFRCLVANALKYNILY